ncbi:hypothetical protein V1507DRAFT_468039 [Lipomyces tetrasporus]
MSACEHVRMSAFHQQSRQYIARQYPQLSSFGPSGTVKTDLQNSREGSMLIRAFQTLVVPKSVEDGAKSKLSKRYCEQGYYEPIGVSRRAAINQGIRTCQGALGMDRDGSQGTLLRDQEKVLCRIAQQRIQ